MKIAFFAALALVASLASASAQTVPRTVTMSGQGEERVTPDMVTLSAGVTSQGPTAAAALSANSGRMQSVFAALGRLGIADKDMQTIDFSVSPLTAGNDTQAPRITGYEVRNQLQMRLEDISNLGAALDTLVNAGANAMSGVEFSIKNPAPLLSQARADAVADARIKAETYAKAAGLSLGQILSISEGQAQGPRPVYAPPMAMAVRAVPVAAGEESVAAGVTIVWEIQG